ncbi:protocadherin gamma-B2 [Xenopus tropicalis]|uniref:Protocadherin gamma-B2 n=1 Tax=Xenopus tropicalis TaxID=8364 RepID=A0A8J0QIY4_XENTR|nr:protocadherin gamma-B2 [Xenopus tropicalis]
MICGNIQKAVTWQVFFFILCLFYNVLYGQIQYSIPEEMKQGSVIGNIANDFNLDVKELSLRNLHIASHDKKQYVNVNLENGDLVITEKIDREALCGTEQQCILNLKAMIENPLQIFSIKVEIQDINDNAPSFPKNSLKIVISESALPGVRFGLGYAQDPDLGINSVQSYGLSTNDYFILGERTSSDGSKYPELVLEKSLDREQQSSIELSLTASDGGRPMKTGTTLIRIVVYDTNDNHPVFSQDNYQVNIYENVANNFSVLQIQASDIDEGANGQITYSFTHIPENALHIFSIDSQTGQITKIGDLDYEVTKKYTLTVEAKDGGELVSHCKVSIQVIDANDNAPEIQINSFLGTVPEDSPPETVIAIIYVHDLDSGENGEVVCQIPENLPFQLITLTESYYKLVTLSRMDRERISEYNISITAKDKGTPSLSSLKTIRVALTDVNDNIPVFEKTHYVTYVPENNQPGMSILHVNALDLDINDNGFITYSVISTDIQNIPISSHVSINSATGVIYALHAFDYEQIREFEFQVMATDNGSPSLSSNATIRVCIIDKNDNSPKILYPSSDTEGTALYEFIPQSSERGYLVTKVIAVDADSGHNAWLSYHLLQTQEPSVVMIGQSTGEIRLARDFQETDSTRQKIVVMVKDNGEPALSATVTLNLIIAENFQVLPETNNKSVKLDNPSNLSLYLVIAIAMISLLFIITVTGTLVYKCRKSNPSPTFGMFDKDIYPQVAFRYPTQLSDGTLPFPFSYDVCVTLDSSQNEFAYRKPSENIPTESLIDTDNLVIINDSIKEVLPDSGLSQVR